MTINIQSRDSLLQECVKEFISENQNHLEIIDVSSKEEFNQSAEIIPIIIKIAEITVPAILSGLFSVYVSRMTKKDEVSKVIVIIEGDTKTIKTELKSEYSDEIKEISLEEIDKIRLIKEDEA